MWVIWKSLRQLTLALALPAFFRDSQFVNLHSYLQCWSFITTKGTWNSSEGSSHSDLKRQQKSAVQLVLQHCCKTSWKAILRSLLPRFKPLLQQIRLLQVAWILTSDWINYTGVTQYKEVTSLTAKGAAKGLLSESKAWMWNESPRGICVRKITLKIAYLGDWLIVLLKRHILKIAWQKNFRFHCNISTPLILWRKHHSLIPWRNFMIIYLDFCSPLRLWRTGASMLRASKGTRGDTFLLRSFSRFLETRRDSLPS